MIIRKSHANVFLQDKDADMETETNQNEAASSQRIFTIKSVNTYGSSDLDSFEDDDTELHLSSKYINSSIFYS